MIDARYRLLAFSTVCLVGLVIAQVAARPDLRRRNYEFMPEMVTSIAAESQSAFAALPSGRTGQLLVPGVVLRGVRPFRYGLGTDEEERAGRELVNPFADDTTLALRRGADVYRIFCAPCHGLGGAGSGPVTRRGMTPPPSLMGANAVGMPDGRMFHIMTLGRGNMAAYAGHVGTDDRWKAIRHIRQLQESAR